jgi:hypothetical protein
MVHLQPSINCYSACIIACYSRRSGVPPIALYSLIPLPAHRFPHDRCSFDVSVCRWACDLRSGCDGATKVATAPRRLCRLNFTELCCGSHIQTPRIDTNHPHHEPKIGLRKIVTSLVAVAALGTAAVATSSAAEARWWGPGWGPGPFIAGAIVGGAVAAAATAPYYSAPYGPYAYYANPTAIMGRHASACGTAIIGSAPATKSAA